MASIILIIVVVALLSNKGEQQVDSVDDSTGIEQNDYLGALRKCTVMEGADIYNTGVGRKSDNVFNDARETCEGWYSSWGESDFFSAVDEDWENRKDEQIDGKDLMYYLDILGW